MILVKGLHQLTHFILSFTPFSGQKVSLSTVAAFTSRDWIDVVCGLTLSLALPVLWLLGWPVLPE